MSGVDWLGYTEEISTFDFREEDGITIPKSVRERAFSLQVDVEIVSTIGNDYKNNKSAPAFGFYGYAVLVFRDYADIQIPINQPRQRLYYGRCSEAFTLWKALHSERESRILANEFIVAFGTFWGAAGLEDYPLVARQCPVWGGFEELPLREVYVKTRFGTQFRLEVSRWIPIIRTGDPDGCNYDGKSQQIDGDKDDGLPSNGSQPRTASNPANPYSGLPPVTPDSIQLEFSNSKIANVDDPNPDNAPIDSSAYGILWGWAQSCRPSGIAQNVAQAMKYADLLPTDIISASIVAGITCNSDQAVRMINQRTNEVYGEFYGGQGYFLSVNGSAPAAFIVLISSRNDWLN